MTYTDLQTELHTVLTALCYHNFAGKKQAKLTGPDAVKANNAKIRELRKQETSIKEKMHQIIKRA